MSKKIVAMLMAVAMAFSLLPVTAFAEEGTTETTTGTKVAQVIQEGEEATQYDTLEGAFTAAPDGATVQLLADYELTSSITLDKTLTLDLSEKTITVNIVAESSTANAFILTSNANFTLKNGKVVGAEKVNVTDNGTISSETLKDNRAIKVSGGSVLIKNVTLGDFAAKTGNGAVVCAENGTVTIEDSSLGFYNRETKEQGYNFALNGGAVYTKDSTVTIQKTNLFYNHAKDDSGSTSQYWFGGGAVFIDGGNATIKESYFFLNRTWDYGGAIHLDGVDKAVVDENRIISSAAYNHRLAESGARGGDGGAIYSRISKKITITGNTITEGFTMGNGAGIDVLGNTGSYTELDNNIISENYAGGHGGGIKLTLSKDSVVNLGSGTISDNTAGSFGGGIDYTTHDMPALELQNVLITDNTAVRGAGIWACPTSETQIYSTLGGAIYGNEASGEVSTGIGKPALGASGNEIRYEGKDCEDSFALQSNPASETTTMTVTKRALGGGLMQWYSDSTIDRYEEGDAEAESTLYTNTDQSFGLHGNLSVDYQKLAQTEAKLIITGNQAKRGGGIATNSPVIIGMKDSDVKVIVEKKWPEPEAKEQAIQDAQEETHPTEVKVDLYRVNADTTEIKLDSDVVLNADNNWKAEFTDLPSQYIDENGAVQKCTYTVREQAIKGWQCKTESNLDGDTYYISLTNTPAQLGDLKVSKTVTGSGSTTKDFTFTVTLSDQNLNGTFGDMSFTNGVASFTLKHNESKTATGLNAGTTYIVTESDNAGYTVTKTGDTGTIEKDKTAEVKFTNYKGSSGGNGGNSKPSLNTKDHYGYIIGYPVDYYTGQPTTDQTKKPVRPEGKITRAEVATIYFRMLTDESRTKFWSQSNSYSDVKAGDWFNNAVSTLSKAGIIAGYEDGSFRPNGYITRAEFATIAARFFDVTYNGKDLFPDISGHWAKDYINQAANKGFVNGYEDGTFKPDRNITRAEAVTLVNRTLDRHPDKSHFTKDMLVWPDNMDQTKWYYADMQEATNSHTYQMKENSDKTKYENWTKTLPIRNWEALEKAWSNANSSQGNGNVV